MPDVLDIKKVSEDLHGLFDSYKKENDARLEKIEKGVSGVSQFDEKLAKLDKLIELKENEWKELFKEIKRPKEDDNEPKASEAKEAFANFLRGKASDEDRKILQKSPRPPNSVVTPIEQKAYLSGTAGQGEEWAPEEFINDLARDLQEMSPVRSVARIRTTRFAKVEQPTHTGAGAATWTAEAGTRSAATQATSAVVTLEPHEIQARYDASRESLFDVAFDLESEIRTDQVEQIAIKEGNGFIKGNGTAPNPTGFLANVGTTVDIGATIAADDLISLYFAIKTGYARNGTWGARRSVIEAIRKLKDGSNRYLWDFAPPGGITQGSPGTLLGRPVVEMPDVDAVGADLSGNRPVVFGDFRRGYMIVDQQAFRVFTDPYSDSATGMVRFYGYKYTTGNVIKAEALASLVQ